MNDKLRAAAKAALDWLESTKTQSMEEYLQVIDSLKAALAEPEQEPVAWMSDCDVGFIKSEFGKYPCVPLYTAPPRREWVGLTQTQVKLLREGVHEESIKTGDSIDWVFYTHINEALKEKNCG